MEAVVRRLTILSAALFLALAGCSSNSGAGAATTGDRKPAGPFGGDVTSTATETATTPATATTAATAATGEHRLGDTVELPVRGVVLELTAIQFLDPNAPGGPSPKPASSDSRRVAVEFKIVSKGSADVVFDNGEAGFNVRTATGAYPGGGDGETEFGPGIDGIGTFRIGQTKHGFAAFSVPKEAQIQVVRFYTSTKSGDSWVDWLVQ
jgi:hypothetical protein